MPTFFLVFAFFATNASFLRVITNVSIQFRKNERNTEKYEQIKSWNITLFDYNQTKTNNIEVHKEILCVLKVWNILGKKKEIQKDDIFEIDGIEELGFLFRNSQCVDGASWNGLRKLEPRVRERSISLDDCIWAKIS